MESSIARPYLRIRVTNPHTGKSWDTLGQIDTGADVCTFSSALAQRLGHDLEKGDLSECGTANGMISAYAHTTSMEIFSLEGKSLLRIENIQAHYIQNFDGALLGVGGFLHRYKLTVDYPRKYFSITLP